MELQYCEIYAFKVGFDKGSVNLEWYTSVPTASNPSITQYESLFHARVSSMPDGTPPSAKAVQALFAQAAEAVLSLIAVDEELAKNPESVPLAITTGDKLHRLVGKAHMDHLNKKE